MRAAIYARRSTEEHQAESLDTQLDGARRFIAAKGWTEAAAFTDDGSRAEFRRRRGLIAMLLAAKQGAFDVVVTRDESRIGGDMLRTGLTIQELNDGGVQIWYYASAQRVQIDTAVGRFVEMARNFASELEREKISSRTREHLEKKARRGLVAGGVVYGYNNVRSADGVRRVVHPEEAAVVREVFERKAKGEGLRTIAHWLNGANVAPPRGGLSGWGTAALYAILRRPLYAGQIEWGRAHKAYRGGTKVRLDEHDREIVRVEAPELRIVSPELWEAVQRRNREPRPRRGPAPRYLLTGFSRCATCGGPMQVDRSKRSYSVVSAYLCGYHRDRGATVCTNTLRRPVADVDAAVIEWFRRNVLSEAVIRTVMVRLRARLAGDKHPLAAELEQLDGRARRLRGELERLTQAIASASGPLATLVAGVETRQAELDRLAARREEIGDPEQLTHLSARRLEQRARARLGELHGLLTDHPQQARKVLEAVLVGPLRWTATRTPEGARYQISGQATVGRFMLTETSRGVLEASPAGVALFPSLPVSVAA